MSLLVLGVGSPRGADRLGWQVVSRLRETGLPGGVRLEASDRPGPALLGLLEDTLGAVIVDAMVGGCEPGAVVRLEAGELPATGRSMSSHDLGVETALELGRSLGMLPPRLWLVGLCVGEQQAPVSEYQLQQVVGVVTGLVAELRAATAQMS